MREAAKLHLRTTPRQQCTAILHDVNPYILAFASFREWETLVVDPDDVLE